MVESRSCSRVWDQNNPQTVPEIGSTPSSYRPWNSLYVGNFFFSPNVGSREGGVSAWCREGGGLGMVPRGGGLGMVQAEKLENPIGAQIR